LKKEKENAAKKGPISVTHTVHECTFPGGRGGRPAREELRGDLN